MEFYNWRKILHLLLERVNYYNFGHFSFLSFFFNSKPKNVASLNLGSSYAPVYSLRVR